MADRYAELRTAVDESKELRRRGLLARSTSFSRLASPSTVGTLLADLADTQARLEEAEAVVDAARKVVNPPWSHVRMVELRDALAALAADQGSAAGLSEPDGCSATSETGGEPKGETSAYAFGSESPTVEDAE